jgi:hypothetical protein
METLWEVGTVTRVHPRVAQRHPELSDDDVTEAWEHFEAAAVRVPGEVEMRIGYDLRGRRIEMAGRLLEDGWLVYHAMTPPSKKTEREIAEAMRRGY